MMKVSNDNEWYNNKNNKYAIKYAKVRDPLLVIQIKINLTLLLSYWNPHMKVVPKGRYINLSPIKYTNYILPTILLILVNGFKYPLCQSSYVDNETRFYFRLAGI